jgi:hypothetical protein
MTFPPYEDGQPMDPNGGATPPAYAQPSAYPPGYPPPGYPPQAYPPQAWAYGYPPPAYAYGYPPPGNGRPGAVVASSVLAYILAGLLIISGVILLAVASSADELYDTFDAGGHRVTGELTADGFVDFLAAGLLIAGGVLFTTRRRTGRTMILVGNAITVAAAIYWVARTSGDAGAGVWITLFTALAVVGAGLSLSARAAAWLGPKP